MPGCHGASKLPQAGFPFVTGAGASRDASREQWPGEGVRSTPDSIPAKGKPAVFRCARHGVCHD
jgi:hypothetical protein